MLRKKFVLNQFSKFSRKSVIKAQNGQKIGIMEILKRQLNFMNGLLQDNPKEYHVWTYKKDLISFVLRFFQNDQNQQINKQAIRIVKCLLQQKESQFIFHLLLEDCRNYHAWDYRFWLITFLGKIQLQFEWIQNLLKESQKQNSILKQTLEKLQNTEIVAKEMKICWSEVNSVWSHKFNLIKYLKQNSNFHKNSQNHEINWKVVLDKQIKETTKLLKENKKNECIWNYLGGLIYQKKLQVGEQKFIQTAKVFRQLFELDQNQKLHLEKLNRYELFFVRRFSSIFKSQSIEGNFEEQIYLQLKMVDHTRQKYYDYMLQKIKADSKSQS